MTLLIDGNKGIRIPQIFAEQFKNLLEDAEAYKEDLSDLRSGPDNANYWDAWDSILNAPLKEGKFLHQDDDLFLCEESDDSAPGLNLLG